VTIARSLVLVFFLVSAGILASGCGAGDGGVCQVDGDCASGLSCQCKLGGGVDARGLCRAPGAPACTTTSDSGPRPDSGPPSDAGSEAGAPDTGPSEAGTGDGGADAGSDAGSDGGTDAAMSVDAAIDATNDAG
jgi:hypothetical protein